MPIYINSFCGKAKGEKPDNLDWLCDGEWELPAQIEQLEKWLEAKGKNLEPGLYVADIGFSLREGALGGGAILTHESMAIMGSIGMNLYLSEYPE